MLNDRSHKVRAILKKYCPGNIKKILPSSQSAWNTRFYFGHQKLCMDNNVKYPLQYEACKTVNWASTNRSCLCLFMLVDVDVIQKFKWIENNIIFRYYNWPLTYCRLLRQNWCRVIKRHTAFEMLCTVHWFKNQQLQNNGMWLKLVWYCHVQVSSHVTLNDFHSYFNNGLRQRTDTKE